jgi:uncharacterized protein (TIGR00730 family)
MDTSNSVPSLEELHVFADSLKHHPQGDLIAKTLRQLMAIAAEPKHTRLDWKIIRSTMRDMGNAISAFAPHQHRRKVAVFGSARITEDTAIYQEAMRFSQRIQEVGFMVLTGAGGGVMEAGNRGAGQADSFGLNIDLPFEQDANPYIDRNGKLIDFRYFFARKLFFIRESDGFAVFPGGMGTQDECFELLTLLQTGRTPPMPLVLIDPPGGNYWKSWDEYIRGQLLGNRLISPEDLNLYWRTDNIEAAAQHIQHFYRIYHSSRYVDDILVLRLQVSLSDPYLAFLNAKFADILVAGEIQKSVALPEEDIDETTPLPRLTLKFNRSSHGRLRQLIDAINDYIPETTQTESGMEQV